jgi:hypothetical protein
MPDNRNKQQADSSDTTQLRFVADDDIAKAGGMAALSGDGLKAVSAILNPAEIAALRAAEPALVSRLSSQPALAAAYYLDPVGCLASWGLITDPVLLGKLRDLAAKARAQEQRVVLDPKQRIAMR